MKEKDIIDKLIFIKDNYYNMDISTSIHAVNSYYYLINQIEDDIISYDTLLPYISIFNYLISNYIEIDNENNIINIYIRDNYIEELFKKLNNDIIMESIMNNINYDYDKEYSFEIFECNVTYNIDDITNKTLNLKNDRDKEIW
jgi:hypothetical protein